MKRIKLIKTLAPLLTIAVAINLASCIAPPYYPPGAPVQGNSNGNLFKADLERAIINSDRIVVLQHSHASDFSSFISNPSKAPYYSYGSRILSSSAKSSFLNRVRNLSAYNRAGSSTNQFTPHHTIKFYTAGHLKSTMSVCFGCSNVKWNGSRHTPSQDILRAISPTIANAGFSTNRDWDGLARIEYNSGGRTPGSTPQPRPPVTRPTAPSLPDPVAPAPPKPTVPTAKKVPGKPGMVFNPFTNNEVDVNGIPGGTKVRDPHDKNKKHIFKVP